MTNDRVENYHVFRPARPLFDPDDTARKTPIAYEAFYLGTARMAKRGEVATLTIQQSKQEIGVGDRLVPIERQPFVTYVPRAPERASTAASCRSTAVCSRPARRASSRSIAASATAWKSATCWR